MTRGKYAAKAANRLAELDTEIVADLKRKLAEVKGERDEARREASTLRAKLATEVHGMARELASLRIADVSAGLAAEKQARVADREQFAREVFAVFHEWNAFPPLKVQADLAKVFGMSDRVGDLLQIGPDNRHKRRATAGKLRELQASVDAKDRWI